MSTEYMNARGVIMDGDGKMKMSVMTVRFTSDKRGESLSISDDKTIMLQVNFAGVEELTEQARASK